MRRAVPYAVATIAVCAVLLPLLRPDAGDSYPLSSYPMFTAERDREESVATAVAVTEEGVAVRLSPAQLAGTDEVIHAAATLSRAVRDSRTDPLCVEIAARLSDGGAVTHVEVRTETYDTIDWFAKREPVDVVLHSRCAIP